MIDNVVDILYNSHKSNEISNMIYNVYINKNICREADDIWRDINE